MKAEALARLRAVMRGELRAVTPRHVTIAPRVTPETPSVTLVTPVTPEIERRGNAEAATALLEAIEERAGLAADRVLSVYLDAWARLNCQKPAGVSETERRLALDDGGCFLDGWGYVVADTGWTPGELFDVTAGLIWRLAGAGVEAVGRDHALLSDGRIVRRRDCQ